MCVLIIVDFWFFSRDISWISHWAAYFQVILGLVLFFIALLVSASYIIDFLNFKSIISHSIVSLSGWLVLLNFAFIFFLHEVLILRILILSSCDNHFYSILDYKINMTNLSLRFSTFLKNSLLTGPLKIDVFGYSRGSYLSSFLTGDLDFMILAVMSFF